MPLSNIEKVRLAVADTDIALPILADSSYEYFLEKNSNNINRSALDAARTILLTLATRGDQTVDILSIKGSKAAEQYRLALQMFLKSPDLNPVLNNCQGYAGGISLSDMQANNDAIDNNIVTTPDTTVYTQISSSGDYFKV